LSVAANLARGPFTFGGSRHWLYLLLAVLPVLLALPRLITGPWYHVHTPPGARLLEGWPIAWESTYYLMHFPTFLSDAPADGTPFTSVQYRTWPNLYLATVVYAFIGSAFWSMAAVDWLFWFLGGVAGYHVALRLGASPRASTLCAVLISAAPLFACSIWRIDLRLSNSASMAIGLWAALVLFEEYRSAFRLALGLGVLLLLLSLSYQYQWILAPMLLVLALTHERLSRAKGVAVVGGAVAFYALGTLFLKSLVSLALPSTADETNGIVAGAEELLAARLAEVRSFEHVLAYLPSWYHIRLMAEAYHPLVFGAGLVGLFLLPVRTRWLAMVALLATLFSTVLYPYPWLAMSAYPIIYAGVGMTCVAIGRRVAGFVGSGWGRCVGGWDRLDARVAGIVTLSLAVVFAVLPNVDLLGDPSFLLRWWDYWERLAF
jgi:hypothetical protein